MSNGWDICNCTAVSASATGLSQEEDACHVMRLTTSVPVQLRQISYNVLQSAQCCIQIPMWISRRRIMQARYQEAYGEGKLIGEPDIFL